MRRTIKEKLALPLKQKLIKYKKDALEAGETIKGR